MRALKFIGLFILLLAVVVFVLAFISPSKIDVRRSVIIASTPQMVGEQMFNLRNWEHWNPFYEQDTTLSITYRAEPTIPVKSLTWKRNEEIRSGTVTTGEASDIQLTYHVQFPNKGVETLFADNGNGYMKVEDVGGDKVKATWNYSQDIPFPANALILLWNSDNSLGQSFEHGLQTLKMYVESGAAAVTSPPKVVNTYPISEVVFQRHLYAVTRKTVSHKDLIDFFDKSYRQLQQNKDLSINGPRIGIFYKWDAENKKTDVAAGFPVAEKGKGKISYVAIEPSPAFMTVHKGGYGSSAAAHMALGNHLAEMNKTQTMVIEEYITGPFNETDSMKWLTNIYYLVPADAEKSSADTQ